VLFVAGDAKECFENLLRRKSYLFGNDDGGEVFRIERVVSQFVGDVERVKITGSVRFHGCILAAKEL